MPTVVPQDPASSHHGDTTPGVLQDPMLGLFSFMTVLPSGSLNMLSHDHIIACVREFSSEEVKTATGDLSDSVGKGGFGTVYRGTFHHIPVAVKVLNAVSWHYTTKLMTSLNNFPAPGM